MEEVLPKDTIRPLAHTLMTLTKLSHGDHSSAKELTAVWYVTVLDHGILSIGLIVPHPWLRQGFAMSVTVRAEPMTV